MTNSDAGSSQPSLPTELWSEVFSYLLVKDLKSVRRTCRLFYEACDTVTFHENEQLVFPERPDGDILHSLYDVEKKVWNIKLDQTVMIDRLGSSDIEPFFLVNAANIRSLTLDYSSTWFRTDHGKLLASIVKCCKSLRSFSVYIPEYRIDGDSNGLATFFETLRKKKAVCTNVESFTFVENYHYNETRLRNYTFVTIFQVFPNIKQLEMTVVADRRFDDFGTDTSELKTNKAITFSSIYRQLFQLREQLERLKLHFMYAITEEPYSAESYRKISQIEMKNLKELRLHWPNLWDSSVVNPFSQFDRLTEMKCFIKSVFPVTISDFVRLLLESQEKLRYLDLRTTSKSVIVDERCFQALVTSRLTTLVICCRKHLGLLEFRSNADLFHGDHFKDSASLIANFDYSSLESSLKPNYTLKHLRANLSNNNSLSLFSAYFLRLNNL